MKGGSVMKHVNTKIGLIIAVLTIGIFTVAMAHDGNGTAYRGHMMGPGMMGYGMGYHGHMMDNGYGHMMGNNYQGYGNLSSEDAAKYQDLQKQFLNETENLRNTIQEMQLALNQEFESTSPNASKAVELQNEISKLESELDQKAVEHQLELKQTFPDATVPMGYGYGEYCWR